MKKTNLFFVIALCAMFFLPSLLHLPFGKDLGWASCSAQNVGINATGALPNASATYSREVPFTLEDRDRIIQMQIKMDEHFESINTRFESINTRFESQQQQITELKESMQQQFSGIQQQISDLKNLFYWTFGIIITLIIFMLGFIIWDRRTAMEPLRERTQSLFLTLREYAKEQPKLADILRSYGLL